MVSEISSKASDSMRTASLDEASDLLRKLAGNRLAGESMKAVFRRVSRKLTNWSDSRIRDVWHRDKRVRIRAEEVEQLRALVNRQGNTRDELDELRSTVARLARYETLLQRIDAEFFGPEISATRDQAGEAGGVLGTRGVRIRPEP